MLAGFVLFVLHEATVGARCDLDRLAAAALCEMAREERKLVERDAVGRASRRTRANAIADIVVLRAGGHGAMSNATYDGTRRPADGHRDLAHPCALAMSIDQTVADAILNLAAVEAGKAWAEMQDAEG